MSTQEICKLINLLESKFEVNSWKYKGIDLWPIVRWNYFTKLDYHYNNLTLSKNTEKIGLLKLLKLLFIQGIVLFRFVCRKDKNIDVIALADTSYIFDNNAWFQVWIDPILLKLSKSNARRFTTFDTYLPPINRPTTPTIAIGVILAVIRFVSKFEKRLIKDEGLFLPNKDNLDKYLREKKMLPIMSSSKIRSEGGKVYWYSLFFKRILRNCRSKLVLMVNYYNPIGYGLVHASKVLSIPSVDIQHGVQGKMHMAYGNWQNIPKDGFNILPSIFWCWSENDKLNIESWAKELFNHKSIYGGHPFINHFRELKQENNISDITQDLLNDRNTILVTVQHNYLDKFYLPLFKIFHDLEDSYNWIWRIHPTLFNDSDKLEEVLSILSEQKIKVKNVIFWSKMPLPKLLYLTDLHITSNSSVIIEAYLFGIHSLVIDKSAIEYFKYLNIGSYIHYSDTFITSKNSLDNLINLKSGDSKDESSFNNGIGVLSNILSEE